MTFDHVVDLIEGRQNIVPGTISFTDLGLTDAAWVRNPLLNEGLLCLLSAMELHPKLVDVKFEDWHTSSLTGLPLLTQRCARAWEAMVRAIRDINGQEKGEKRILFVRWLTPNVFEQR